MNNIVSFPRPADKKVKTVKSGKAMTLFLHVKNATMIVHLAANSGAAAQSGQVGAS
ncbi:MAG: hypothetical protein OIF48_08435 [Silicimonas sp.]|nr:hypothetical protein [Silicimonas sp.]